MAAAHLTARDLPESSVTMWQVFSCELTVLVKCATLVGHSLPMVFSVVLVDRAVPARLRSDWATMCVRMLYSMRLNSMALLGQ